MSGRFITFEGIEGVGKSTQLTATSAFLEARGYRVTLTREPGGTPLGEKLRAVLLDPDNQRMCAETELLLMFAARAQHLDERILPELATGGWVLCDRFTDATYAYQGGGRGLGVDRVAVLEEWVQGSLRPDLTVLLDADPALGFQRVAKRQGNSADRIEREQDTFFTRVRESYLTLARRFPDRFAVVDAAGDQQAVQEEIQQVLRERLNA